MDNATVNTTSTNFDSAESKIDVVWIMCMSTLVFFVVPGIAYFYSGQSQTKNALFMMLLVLISVALVSIEWFLVGYSLALSPTSQSSFIGNFEFSLFNVFSKLNSVNQSLPELAYAFFMGLFACITPAIVIGGVADRGRVLSSIAFILLWSLFVYNFVAYWTWGANGWGAKLGALDYAGGAPVHISSGFSALAYSLMLGKRTGLKTKSFKPTNLTHIIIGTSLIWLGWFPFNGGSTLKPDFRAIVAFVCTHLSACSGALTMLAIEYITTKKFCVLSLCNGVIAGLVAITPAAGLVQPVSSLLFGVFGASTSSLFLKFKDRFPFDDAFDLLGIHGLAGIVGSILTGIFARKHIASLDPNLNIEGGWLDGNWMQVPYQLAMSGAIAIWSFVVSLIILFVLDKSKLFKIRVSSKVEQNGIDYEELGTSAYPDIINENRLPNSKTQADTINTIIN